MRILNDLVAVRSSDDPELLRRRLARDGYRVCTTGPWVVGVATLGDAESHQVGSEVFLIEGRSSRTLNERVLRAEPEALARLSHDVAFMRISSCGAQAVSSVAGVVPVYYWFDGGRAAIATRLADMARFVLNDPTLDLETTALFVTSATWPDERTFLRGVHVLPPGCVLTLPAPARIRRYWEWTSFEPEPPTRQAFLDASAALRIKLLRRLDEALTPRENLLTVSGGVDSSVVASLATGVLERRICTVTFLPADSRAAEREREFVRTLRDQAASGIQRSWEWTLDVPARLKRMSEGRPVLFHTAHPLLCSISELTRAQDLRVYAGGEFADGLFGSRTVMDDWMTTLCTRHVLQRPSLAPLIIRYARGLGRVRRAAAAGKLPIPMPEGPAEILDRGFSAAHGDLVHGWQRRATETRRGYFELRLSRAHALKSAYWEAMSRVGVAPSFPFHGREMLELALSVDPVQNVGWKGKRLLRHAARGLVPSRNLSRADKGNYPQVVPELTWATELPSELGGLVREDWLPRPPGRIHGLAALHLQALVNIVKALRIERQNRDQPRDE